MAEHDNQQITRREAFQKVFTENPWFKGKKALIAGSWLVISTPTYAQMIDDFNNGEESTGNVSKTLIADAAFCGGILTLYEEVHRAVPTSEAEISRRNFLQRVRDNVFASTAYITVFNTSLLGASQAEKVIK